MAKSFLALAECAKDTFYHRYIEDGVRKVERVQFRPFVATEASQHSTSEFKTMNGRPLDVRQFESISEYRGWKKENQDYINIYGEIAPEYMFLAQTYREPSAIQFEHMHIDNLDIEVHSENGFMPPEIADDPITLITVQDLVTKKYTTFGWKEDIEPIENVTYIKCTDEREMLQAFVTYAHDRVIDILTGWNINGYDVTYLVTRIMKLLGSNWAAKLSPIGKIKKVVGTDDYDKERVTYVIYGTAILDYKELYEKFQLDPRDGYSLEIVAKAELGKGKLDYKSGDHRNLVDLFLHDYPTYVRYNVKDTTLVGEIDDKRQYIRLALNMMYRSRCLPEDVYGTVKIWDAYLYNALLAENIFCPPRKVNEKEKFPGGWVGEPRRGLNGYTAVEDVESSYPNTIISYNISPECIINLNSLPEELINLAHSIKPKYDPSQDTWLISEKIFDIDYVEQSIHPMLEKYDVCMTPWGEFFTRDFVGFIPKVVSIVFADRKAAKKEMKQFAEGSPDYIALDALQGALKVMMNSLYGAMSNVWFRYFDIRMAGSITSGGQTTVKGVAKFVEDRLPFVKNLYTDTDSCFFDLEPALKMRFGVQELPMSRKHDFCMGFIKEVIDPKITEFIDRLTKGLNCKQQTIKMSFEILSDAWIIVEKKKYSMRVMNKEGAEKFDRATESYKKVTLKTKGLTLVQSTVPEYAREKLGQALEIIFEYKTRDAVFKKFEEWKDGFKKLSFEEASMPRGVATFDKYVQGAGGAGAHVRGAMLYNRMLDKMQLTHKYRKIVQGDKIRYAYMKQPNYLLTDVLAMGDRFPDEFRELAQIDWEVQWEKCFVSQMKKIFDTLNWRIDDNDVSLESFFS